MAPEHFRPEIELTYNVGLRDVGTVMRRVAPCSGAVRIDGEQFLLRKHKNLAAAYFFLASSVPSRRDRFIFRFRKRGVTGRFSPKCWVAGPGGLVKHQLREPGDLSLRDSIQFLANSAPVVSSLVKVKDEFVYASGRGRSFRAGLHGMIAFSAAEPARHGQPFFQIEFEEECDWDPAVFQSSSFFKEHLRPFLTTQGESKMTTALAFGGQPCRLPFASERELLGYLRGLEQEVLPLIPGLASAPQAGPRCTCPACVPVGGVGRG